MRKSTCLAFWLVSVFGLPAVSTASAPAVSRSKLSDGAEEIKTPYGEYVITEPEKTTEDSSSGIGVRIVKANSGMEIAEVIPAGPAEKAGLKKGDIIESISLGAGAMGRTGAMSLEEATKSLRGKSGTAVSLRIRRPGTKKVRSVSVIRSSAAFHGQRPENSTVKQIPLTDIGQKQCPAQWHACYLLMGDTVSCHYSCPPGKN